jgi:hypothetical protein
MRSACKTLVWKLERKRPCGILWYRWDNNIEMDLKEMGMRI